MKLSFLRLAHAAVRLIFCAAALGSVLFALPGAAAEWDIDQLMGELAQTRSGRASFVERKSIALLDKPVESSGELYFSAPDRLEKRTLKPKPETLIVDGGELTIERGRQKHTLQLADYPELAAFIDSIRGTLAGDRKALERNYRITLDGSGERWQLQLVPLDEKMQAVVKHVRITGTRGELRSVEAVQTDGDSSLMLVKKLATTP